MVAEEAAGRHLEAVTDPGEVTAYQSNGALRLLEISDAFRDCSGSPTQKC